MWRCEICDYQSKPEEPQMKIVTKRRMLYKTFIDYQGRERKVRDGWEIEEEKKVCAGCYKREVKK